MTFPDQVPLMRSSAVTGGSSAAGATVPMSAAALAPVFADGRTVGVPGVITGTRLLVNLYEPSQVERAAGLTWTAWG